MTNALQKLYTLAEDKGFDISVTNQKRLGFATVIGGTGCIFLSTKALETERLEESVLAEEYAHLACGYVYRFSGLSNPLERQNIVKAERKTRDVASSLLVPLDDLQTALKRTNDINELAEELSVSPETLCTAIRYYKRKKKL